MKLLLCLVLVPASARAQELPAISVARFAAAPQSSPEGELEKLVPQWRLEGIEERDDASARAYKLAAANEENVVFRRALAQLIDAEDGKKGDAEVRARLQEVESRLAIFKFTLELAGEPVVSEELKIKVRVKNLSGRRRLIVRRYASQGGGEIYPVYRLKVPDGGNWHGCRGFSDIVVPFHPITAERKDDFVQKDILIMQPGDELDPYEGKLDAEPNNSWTGYEVGRATITLSYEAERSPVYYWRAGAWRQDAREGDGDEPVDPSDALKSKLAGELFIDLKEAKR